MLFHSQLKKLQANYLDKFRKHPGRSRRINDPPYSLRPKTIQRRGQAIRHTPTNHSTAWTSHPSHAHKPFNGEDKPSVTRPQTIQRRGQAIRHTPTKPFNGADNPPVTRPQTINSVINPPLRRADH